MGAHFDHVNLDLCLCTLMECSCTLPGHIAALQSPPLLPSTNPQTRPLSYAAGQNVRMSGHNNGRFCHAALASAITFFLEECLCKAYAVPFLTSLDLHPMRASATHDQKLRAWTKTFLTMGMEPFTSAL